MNTTDWRTWLGSDGRRFRTRVTYGIRQPFPESEPYFSVTHETELRHHGCWCDNSSGMGLGERPDLFRDLSDLARWHLFAVRTGPLHYVANAVHHAQCMMGVSKWPACYIPAPEAAFRACVVFGALDTDTMPDLTGAFADQDPGDTDPEILKGRRRYDIGVLVSAWCMARLPALMSVFRRDMRKIGVKV